MFTNNQNLHSECPKIRIKVHFKYVVKLLQGHNYMWKVFISIFGDTAIRVVWRGVVFEKKLYTVLSALKAGLPIITIGRETDIPILQFVPFYSSILAD